MVWNKGWIGHDFKDLTLIFSMVKRQNISKSIKSGKWLFGWKSIWISKHVCISSSVMRYTRKTKLLFGYKLEFLIIFQV